MTLETTLVLIMASMFMFFMYMRYKTSVTIYNLFAIGCIVAIGITFSDFIPILIVFITLILWLMYDTFFN